MNPRSGLKLLFLTITLIISSIYIFISAEAIYFYSPANPLYLIPITLLIIILKQKNKKKKHQKIFNFIFTIICLINILLFIYYLYIIISNYIKWNYIEPNFAFYYLIILYTSFILSIFDLKKDTNKLNDILTIIICFIITLVHYRYYIDTHFLHNLVNLDNAMVGNTSNNYINQYYNCFTIMLLTLLIHKKVQNLILKKSYQ